MCAKVERLQSKRHFHARGRSFKCGPAITKKGLPAASVTACVNSIFERQIEVAAKNLERPTQKQSRKIKIFLIFFYGDIASLEVHRPPHINKSHRRSATIVGPLYVQPVERVAETVVAKMAAEVVPTST